MFASTCVHDANARCTRYHWTVKMKTKNSEKLVKHCRIRTSSNDL